MDDLSTLALHNAAHDVDSRVVAVEKAGCGDNADFILKLVTHITYRR
jgi:hypothetical protein